MYKRKLISANIFLCHCRNLETNNIHLKQSQWRENLNWLIQNCIQYWRNFYYKVCLIKQNKHSFTKFTQFGYNIMPRISSSHNIRTFIKIHYCFNITVLTHFRPSCVPNSFNFFTAMRRDGRYREISTRVTEYVWESVAAASFLTWLP